MRHWGGEDERPDSSRSAPVSDIRVLRVAIAPAAAIVADCDGLCSPVHGDGHEDGFPRSNGHSGLGESVCCAVAAVCCSDGCLFDGVDYRDA